MPVWSVTVVDDKGKPTQRYYRAPSREDAARAFRVEPSAVRSTPLAPHAKVGGEPTRWRLG